jgi:hypothetical protein
VPRLELESALLGAIKQKLMGAEYQQRFADEVRQFMKDTAKKRGHVARVTVAAANECWRKSFYRNV